MEFSASVDYIRVIMHFGQQLGINPSRVFRKIGFDTSVLQRPTARIPSYQFNAFWEALEAENSDPYFGLHLGEQIYSFPGHILFLLMLNASNMKDAIDKFCRYFNLFADFTAPSLCVGPELTVMSACFPSTEFTPTRHANEAILAVYLSVLKRISENRIKIEGAYFVHDRPPDISEHHRIFEAPLFFNNAENKLVFKKEYLFLPVLMSNREIMDSLEHLARKHQEKIYAGGTWSEKVSRSISNILKGKKPEIETIASKLAVSPRNLQNRLKKEGVTYQTLLALARKQQALYLLEKHDIPISEIALLLGYSEQSAFGRAFKRWVGCTPGQYRSCIKRKIN